MKIARIEAVQVEQSPSSWETSIETNGLLDVMRRNGISMVRPILSSFILLSSSSVLMTWASAVDRLLPTRTRHVRRHR